MVGDRDIHNFTLTGNWIQEKTLRGGSKQQLSSRNNWATLPDVKKIFEYNESPRPRIEPTQLWNVRRSWLYHAAQKEA